MSSMTISMGVESFLKVDWGVEALGYCFFVGKWSKVWWIKEILAF